MQLNKIIASLFCDAAFPNGADDVLMQILDKQNLLGKFCGFAAWNTASNSLGTVDRTMRRFRFQ